MKPLLFIFSLSIVILLGASINGAKAQSLDGLIIPGHSIASSAYEPTKFVFIHKYHARSIIDLQPSDTTKPVHVYLSRPMTPAEYQRWQVKKDSVLHHGVTFYTLHDSAWSEKK